MTGHFPARTRRLASEPTIRWPTCSDAPTGELGQRVPADRTELGRYPGLAGPAEHQLLEFVGDLLEGLVHHGGAAWRRGGAGWYPPDVHGQQAAALASRQAAGVRGGAQRGP